MKINLGCGNDVQKGYINHDITKHRDDIDIVFDLNETDWCGFVKACFKSTTTFEEIRAWDVIEHINDPINFMDNCWDLLNKDGVLAMKACGWQNPNFWVDITHKKGYDIKSFDYFVVDTSIGKTYNYYTNKKWRFLDGFPHYDRRKNIIVKMSPIK